MIENNKSKNQEVSLLLTTASVVLYLITSEIICLYLAIGIGVIGLFIPPLADILRFLWLKLGEIMGGFMSFIIGGLIFFLFLTPIAFLYKIFGKNRKIQNEQETYWISREYEFTSQDLDNPW